MCPTKNTKQRVLCR